MNITVNNAFGDFVLGGCWIDLSTAETCAKELARVRRQTVYLRVDNVEKVAYVPRKGEVQRLPLV